jgi:hypothetical protein
LTFVDFDMSANSLMQYVDRNVYAGLPEFLSTSEASHDTIQPAYSHRLCECLSRVSNGEWQPALSFIIRALFSAQGTAAPLTSLSRIAYQANLQVLAGLNFLARAPGKPFASSVTVTAGPSGPGEMTLPFPVSAPGLLKSLNPVQVPVPPAVIIPPPQRLGEYFLCREPCLFPLRRPRFQFLR